MLLRLLLTSSADSPRWVARSQSPAASGALVLVAVCGSLGSAAAVGEIDARVDEYVEIAN
jgi:hypothetical protein